MGDAGRLRLFVALELPSQWRNALASEARALESAAPGFARWVDPSLMHVTLVFLGNQDAARVPTIERAVESAADSSPPAVLRLGPPGCFDSRHSVRVVWVGVADQPAGSLAKLHGGVAAQLAEAKVSFDPAPFRAHITLGRARRDATASQSEAMRNAIARRAGGASERADVEALHCEEVTLMRSELHPTGPIYTPLYRARLAQRLADASRRVRDESMRVNAEFSATEQDLNPE